VATSRLARRAALVAVASLVAAGSVWGLAAPAQAHNFLVASTPEVGSTITELPDVISVTTNDTLLDLGGEGAGFGILVQDSLGQYYGDGCVSISGNVLSTPAALGTAGEYTVTWQVVSTDGHPVSSTFVFDWDPSDTATLSDGASTPPDCNGSVAAPSPVATEEATSSAGFDSTVLWVIGTILAVGIAIGVTLLLVRPKKEKD
jgi:methionine-rich copper-binding protein CopC